MNASRGLLALSLAGLLIACGADTEQPTEPTGPIFSEEVDTYITDRMSRTGIPGLGAALVIEGEVVWSGGYGYADRSAGLRATGDTVFLIASISKVVTATAVMQLVERGLVGLDDAIEQHLSIEVRVPGHPDASITPRMLLTHSASIRDNERVADQLYVDGDSDIPLDEFLADYLLTDGAYYDADRNFYDEVPGTRHGYSGVGFALLGLLVESVSGMPFEDYCQAELFEPMGMTRTSWFLSSFEPGEVALPHLSRRGEYRALEHYGVPDYPGLQLRTSAAQLARFLAAFQNGGTYGGERILEADTVEEIRRQQLPELEPSQGLAWFYIDGLQLFGHDGEDDGAVTSMWWRLADGVGVILLTNGDYDASGDDIMAIQERLFEAGADWRQAAE